MADKGGEGGDDRPLRIVPALVDAFRRSVLADPELREWLKGVILEIADKGPIIAVEVHPGGFVDKRKQFIQSAGMANQGDNVTMTNSGTISVGGEAAGPLAEKISAADWKKHMMLVADALREANPDDLGGRLHSLFSSLAYVPPDKGLDHLKNFAATTIETIIPPPEKKVAGGRLKALIEGIAAGTTHAVVGHVIIHYLLPLFGHLG